MLRMKHFLIAVLLAVSPLISFANVVDGNPKGKLTLLEFFDYQCSHCREMANVVDLLIDKNPDLKVVYHVIPVLGSNSWYVARGSLAARAQGKFEPFHDAISAMKGNITPEEVLRVAERLGLDIPKFKKVMESNSVTNEINDNLALSQKINVRSVPTFLIKPSEGNSEGTRYVGSTEYAKLQQGLADTREQY